MNRRDRQRIADIVAAGRNVAEIASEGWPTFQRSWRSVSAACYEMVVIGEAASRLSAEFAAQHPDLPLREAKALRNFVVHEYSKVNRRALWEAMTLSVPNFVRDLQAH